MTEWLKIHFAKFRIRFTRTFLSQQKSAQPIFWSRKRQKWSFGNIALINSYSLLFYQVVHVCNDLGFIMFRVFLLVLLISKIRNVSNKNVEKYRFSLQSNCNWVVLFTMESFSVSPFHALLVSCHDSTFRSVSFKKKTIDFVNSTYTHTHTLFRWRCTYSLGASLHQNQSIS